MPKSLLFHSDSDNCNIGGFCPSVTEWVWHSSLTLHCTSPWACNLQVVVQRGARDTSEPSFCQDMPRSESWDTSAVREPGWTVQGVMGGVSFRLDQLLSVAACRLHYPTGSSMKNIKHTEASMEHDGTIQSETPEFNRLMSYLSGIVAHSIKVATIVVTRCNQPQPLQAQS